MGLLEYMILPISRLENRNYIKEQSFRGSALLPNNTTPAYKKLEVNSVDYIKYIYQKFRKVCNEIFEINVETGKLQNIVHSNEPRIFIMNHTKNQSKDINAAKFFNTLLYREYLYQSKAKTCPRSRVLANTGVLRNTKDKGEELEWMGAIPINAGLGAKDGKDQNKATLKKLIQELIKGNINLFLFPEGALAVLTFLPLKYKFQPGVSSIIKKVLEEKEHIRVTPLCFAHSKKGSAIHIGEDIIFSKKEGIYYSSRGNVDSKYFDKDLQKLYENKESVAITENGLPVDINRIVPFISGILMKNLECCTKEAKFDLKNSSGEVFKL